MGRLMKAVPVFLAAALAIVLLSTCSNPVDFRAAVTDEVKLANDLYLEVSSVVPASLATVSPADPIVIVFDRQLDESTITAAAVTFSPAELWDFDYNGATNTLTILPGALDGPATYTVTITSALKGTDGSSLRQDYAWTFNTLSIPTGGITIDKQAPEDFTGAPYTTDGVVDLSIRANGVVTLMRWSQSEVGLQSEPFVAVVGSIPNVTLVGGEGERTVYLQLKDGAGQETPVLTDTIIQDTVDPTATSISIAAGAAYTTTTSVSLAMAASDATSGLYQMQFSNDAGVTWSSYEAWSATRAAWLLAAGDGPKSVRFRVKDYAGRVSASTPSDGITLDATAPTVSVFNINSNAAYTNSTSATLTISASDTNGINQVRYENKGGTGWTAWEAYTTSKAWTLLTGEGLKIVYFQVSDPAGNVKEVSDSITLDQTAPTISLFSIGFKNPAVTNTATNTLYIAASDAGSGMYQSRYANSGFAYGGWEGYATTKSWALQDKAGTRRVYFQCSDNAGNIATAVYDEILLTARIIVTYNEMLITDDSDLDLFGPVDGEIYYSFYIDGVLKLNRPEANLLRIADPYLISTAQLPQTSYTIYEDPTTGSFQMTGTVYDDDSPFADDYGIMSPITYAAPFIDVASATRAIVGDVAATLSYSIDFANP